MFPKLAIVDERLTKTDRVRKCKARFYVYCQDRSDELQEGEMAILVRERTSHVESQIKVRTWKVQLCVVTLSIPPKQGNVACVHGTYQGKKLLLLSALTSVVQEANK